MAFLIPKPAIINDVQPATPITVIKNFFLYLNKFLAVTLFVNFILFHINVIFSNSILLPGVGAFGNISVAGFSISSLMQV